MAIVNSVNLGDVFDVEAAGDRLALIDCRDWDTPREYTHRELDDAANACARGLLARGYQPGERIMVLSANRAEFYIAYMGILRAGMIAVPISYKFPTETIFFILTDADIRLIICDDVQRQRLQTDLPMVCFDDDGEAGFQALLDPGSFEIFRPSDADVAMVLYTSGSTGRPKGVPLTHFGHLWALRMRTEKGGPYDHHRVLIAAPLYHMNALCVGLFTFAAKATVVLLPEFTPETYMAAIPRFQSTWITSVPTMLAMCFADPKLAAKTDLSSVSIVRMGSAPVSPKLWERVTGAFLDANIVIGYGTTESGPVAYGPRLGEAPPPLSVGWKIEGADTKLIDAEGLEADEGELWHRCPANMPGYLNLPQKTAEVLTEDGWYKTGDVFRCDEGGAYYFVGRVDDMFNCGGENIYPGEVEKVLLAHPDIEDACVVPIADEIKGFKPVAFVVPRAGTTIEADAVKQHALDNAPAFQHPRQVEVMDALPLAGPGKVDRNGLAARAREKWQGAPQTETG
ncbi:MAG: acyl--CoA ligase [Rhodospirillaceae bacterium]|nr:acyl--CoA ligase [Rhodospirillaceae bacterium]MBT7249251.1 acyl--CoA ligase [Rhodospirillaceae bacterium]